MTTVTISVEDEATMQKLLWLLNSMKSEGIKVLSQNKDYSVSKNIPNATTLKAINDPDSEVVEDLRTWMNENA